MASNAHSLQYANPSLPGCAQDMHGGRQAPLRAWIHHHLFKHIFAFWERHAFD